MSMCVRFSPLGEAGTSTGSSPTDAVRSSGCGSCSGSGSCWQLAATAVTASTASAAGTAGLAPATTAALSTHHPIWWFNIKQKSGSNHSNTLKFNEQRLSAPHPAVARSVPRAAAAETAAAVPMATARPAPSAAPPAVTRSTRSFSDNPAPH